jgi:mannose-6-phosphate isomerase-like protein (cupin superfamily)
VEACVIVIRDSSGSGKLLGRVHRASEFSAERLDFCDASDPLQLAAKELTSGQRFRLHRHLPVPRRTDETGEAWVVISGSIRVHAGNDDGSGTVEIDLGPGDCYVRISGAHGMTVLQNHTRLYEIKNGPYLGQIADKEWIEPLPRSEP